MKIKIKKMRPDAVIPHYAHGPDQDAGMDLYAVEGEILRPGVPTLVRTGISIELPPGYEAQVRPRSGLALKHGITVLNSPGTVDPSYRGEVGVILLWNGHNPNDRLVCIGGTPYPPEHGEEIYSVEPGDRIAQLVVSRYEPIDFVEDELNETGRGSGGFGSTGK